MLLLFQAAQKCFDVRSLLPLKRVICQILANKFYLLIGNPALICQINIYAFGGPYIANYALPICQYHQHTANAGIGCNFTCKNV
jgi:hypothetical protein